MKKTVLITGACTNTGVDIVKRFAQNDYNVLFTGRDINKVKVAEENYKKQFPNTLIKGFELQSLLDDKTVDEKGVENLFEQIDQMGLTVFCLVLNAADLGVGIKVFENPLTDFMRVLNTNVVWNYCLVENAAKRMKTAGEGSIVFVNSNTAYRAIPDRIAYSASKSGQLGMMRALALDLGKYNIRVNAVLPGMIRTDRWEKNPDAYNSAPSRFTPLGEVATGADVADAVYFFAQGALNTTGTELTVDGGNMIQLYPIIPKD